jgi:hypothetical protein
MDSNDMLRVRNDHTHAFCKDDSSQKAKTAKILEFAEMAEDELCMNKHAILRKLPDSSQLKVPKRGEC